MKTHNQYAVPPASASLTSRLFSGGFAALSLFFILMAGQAQAATPAANSVISNQATANYKDSGGTDQIATSNQVTTVVAQIGSYDLISPNVKQAAAGTTVYMPHTLTNTGNGTDTFYLTLPTPAAGTFPANDLDSVAIYADTNNNGVPDGPALCTVTNGTTPSGNCTGTTVSTGPLASGATYNFIVAMAVKATAATNATAQQAVTAVPQGTAGQALFDSYPAYEGGHAKSNLDQLTVKNDIPVFAVTKELVGTTVSGPMGSYVQYKLNYTNSGNAAGPLYIKDTIGASGSSTQGYHYINTAGKTPSWSNSGATALTDAQGGDPTGIDYKVSTVSGTGDTTESLIEAFVASVPANASGYVTFWVRVDATGVALGSSQTTNFAKYAAVTDVDCTDLATNAACTLPTTFTDTNFAPFTVVATYSLTAVNNNGASTDVTDATISGVNLDTNPTVAPGAVVSFQNYIWNTGDSDDRFNLTFVDPVSGQTAFPTGTTFKFYQADGVTPLLSSDADGIPDTGIIPSLGNKLIVIQATIPAAACDVGSGFNCTTATNLTVGVRAESKGDPTQSNMVYNQLASITPPSVDLTNDAGTLGAGDGSSAITTPLTVKEIDLTGTTPGKLNPAKFDLRLENKGIAIDNYNLEFHVTNTTTPGDATSAGADLASANDFIASTLPSGWSVVFKDGACGSETTVVSNSGAIAPAGTKDFCAVVTAPQTPAALAGEYNVYFKVSSNATGASDIKLDAVKILPLNKITLTPNGSGQIQPGGTIVYPATLLNGGNNTCNGDFKFDVTNNGSATGWSYVLYLDNNNNGLVDATDTVVSGGTNATDSSTLIASLPQLTAGQEQKLLVKVQAPLGASSGAVDVITVVVTDMAPTNSCGATPIISDTTTVLAGQIRLIKTQALSNWNGTDCDVAGTYSGSESVLSQKPGGCIWYRIVAVNEGDAEVTVVKINDSIPAFTTYAQGAACANKLNMGSITAPTISGAGVASAGSTGAVLCDNWATIPASGEVQMDFAVRVNP